MAKIPFGIALAAAGLLLASSPEARKGARKLAVKGAEVLLEVSDQIKDAAALLQHKTAETDKQAERQPNVY